MGEIWATASETSKYFQQISVHPSKVRLFDDLSVSALGAGTYLGPCDDATDSLYEQVLLQAGLGGVNFFDTAINYRCMRSERVLNRVIRELANRGVSRGQIAISTKGGYLPCEDIETFEDYVRENFLDTGIVERNEIVADCHCMSPSFLENQILMSLKNLGLECIDLYFLHNPEVQLVEVGEEEFYRRLFKAFQSLEKKVAEKKIRCYGLATWNGFRTKKGGLQLAKVLDCAKEAGGEAHHFKAIQLPYNIVMLEAIKIKNQLLEKENHTILKAAEEMKIAVMASSPFMQGKVGSVCPRVFEKLPLEETAMLQMLQYVLSTPGICTAFAGMRQLKHWTENQKSLSRSSWSLEDWERSRVPLGLKPK